jgi:hypothetical protein
MFQQRNPMGTSWRLLHLNPAIVTPRSAVIKTLCLKGLGKPSVFQDFIGGVTRGEFHRDGKSLAADRAVPDIMVTASMTDKIATVLIEDFSDCFTKVLQAARRTA